MSLVATKYYDDHLEFDPLKQLVSAETAQRRHLLKRSSKRSQSSPTEATMETPITDGGVDSSVPGSTPTGCMMKLLGENW
ncbi:MULTISPECIES: hypothetical protein [Halolamina]|uniref:hypothetical protein n=1 Tax=Halolamina TaxID=1075397 RepID=UPI0011605CE2|nr:MULTISPECIES: hypothetical protein [Halolamina]NHX37599.1 hypothetical protein [Halolamina sp. R1-12]